MNSRTLALLCIAATMLIGTVQAAPIVVIDEGLNNTGSTSVIGGSNSYSGKAIAFTMANDGYDYKLHSVVLGLSAAQSGNAFNVALWSDDGSSAPIGAVLEASLTAPGSLVGAGAYTFTSSGTLLAANTKYWVVATNSSTTSIVDWPGSNVTTTTSDIGATHTGRVYAPGGSYATPGTWNLTSSALNQIQVYATLDLTYNNADTDVDWNSNDWNVAGWKDQANAIFDGSNAEVSISGGDVKVSNITFRNAAVTTINGPDDIIFDTPGVISVSADSRATINANITGDSTIVADGTLTVNGTLDAAAVNVFGTLGGSGTITANATFAAGAKLVFDPLKTLDIDGTVSLDDSFSIQSLVNADGTAINWAGVADDTYTLIGTTISDFSNITNFGLADAANLGTKRIAYFQNGSLELVVVTIPEPASLALLGLGGLMAVRRRRRK